MMTKRHKDIGRAGFMTQGGHILAVILMPLCYLLLVPLLRRWIHSGTAMSIACVVLFFPVFVVCHVVADFLTTRTFKRKQDRDTDKSAESDE